MNQYTLREFIITFQFLMRFDCLPAIDAMFEKMIYEDWSKEPLDTNKLLIITFCRANCQWRDKLDFYEPFLAKSVKYLEDNEVEPMKLLKGII